MNSLRVTSGRRANAFFYLQGAQHHAATDERRVALCR